MRKYIQKYIIGCDGIIISLFVLFADILYIYYLINNSDGFDFIVLKDILKINSINIFLVALASWAFGKILLLFINLVLNFKDEKQLKKSIIRRKKFSNGSLCYCIGL